MQIFIALYYNKPQSMQRVYEYDLLRVLAIMLVIFGHCSYYSNITDYGQFGFDEQHSIVGTFLDGCVSFVYTFHMPLFFALSGAMWQMSVSGKGVLQFKQLLISKWKRLLHPFVFALIYVVLIKFSVGFWDDSTSIPRDILFGQVLMINVYGSYLWFLYALFWIFIFAYVLEQLNWREHLYILLPFLFCVSISGSLMVRNHIAFFGIQEALRYFRFHI